MLLRTLPHKSAFRSTNVAEKQSSRRHKRRFTPPQSNAHSQNEGGRELKVGGSAHKGWVTCSSTRRVNIYLFVTRDGIEQKYGNVEGVVVTLEERGYLFYLNAINGPPGSALDLKKNTQ